jgi:hypothetical protein
MTPPKVNRKTLEIPKEISSILDNSVKIPIVELIEKLKDLHHNGYVSLLIELNEQDFYKLKTFACRFETEKEQETRIAKEESRLELFNKNKKLEKEKEKQDLINRAKELGMELVIKK